LGQGHILNLYEQEAAHKKTGETKKFKPKQAKVMNLVQQQIYNIMQEKQKKLKALQDFNQKITKE